MAEKKKMVPHRYWHGYLKPECSGLWDLKARP